MRIPERQEIEIERTDKKQEIEFERPENERQNTTKNTLDRIEKHSKMKQRTSEWYELRQGLFSASNIWKLFASQSQYNSLIYEKCMIQKTSERGDIQNTSNPRNWGIKYEPLSILIYEYKYQTRVKTDYSCIPHIDLLNIRIGASPDGINIEQNSERYGRMVEVKNIFNREIDGIPSEEYWTQMQIQMEVCNLDECDFLETRFKEYISEEEYWSDNTREHKGLILFFISRITSNSLEPIYVYSPMYLNTNDKWGVQIWIQEMKNRYFEYVLYDTTYWYLDEFSCILVRRNMVWFEHTIPVIKDAWNTVLRERISGYEHRAPNKRKESFDSGMDLENSIKNEKKNTLENSANKKQKIYLSKYFEKEQEQEKMEVQEEKEHTVDVFLHNTVHLVKLDEFGNRSG
jgi:hypothetical protein